MKKKMFPRSGQSTLTPEVPRRKHRKGLSSSGHNLNSVGQQKYDRDALAFNHYIGYLKQPLRRHLSSDITYLVPSMPIQLNKDGNNNQPQQLTTREVNQPINYDRPPLALSPEPIYSAPRRQRSFRKQRSLDNPANDNQSKSINCSNLGPNEKPTINQIDYLSIASSVPHLAQQQQSPRNSLLEQQLVKQEKKSDNQLKPISVSTEGLIQHIISQQSQIERLSKQQDFLTQQLLISRDLGSSESSSKRNGRTRTRSRSKSQQLSGSLSSLEPVKRRSSSREKIQEQLHAQQARVQQHIQQLEAQLEMIRDIRTGSSTRPTSRSHSRATSVRDGSSCPPEEEAEEEEEIDHQHQHLNRPLSADPKWLKSSDSTSPQLKDEQLKSTTLVLPTIKTTKSVNSNKGKVNNSDRESVISKPRLMLTNPSEEGKDDDLAIGSENNQGKLIVNRPVLIDEDDGIPFMDDELIDEPPDDNESDELETVFEFDSNVDGEKLDYRDDEELIDREDEDWEDDDELDYYSRSPQAETDQWSRLMEEDILRAREEMDRQRSLMERQEMDLSDQRQQLIGLENDEMINLTPEQLNNQKINQQLLTIKKETETLNQPDIKQLRYSPTHSKQLNQTINQNLIPLTQSRSRSRSPSPFTVEEQTIKSISDHNNYRNQIDTNHGNVFNFNDMETQQFQSQLTSNNQPVNLLTSQPQRLSPNYVNQQQQQRQLTNMINQQQIPTSSGSSFSPVVNRSNQSGNEINYIVGPPKIIDRQISTPINGNNQIKSPNSNYINRPSIEDQPSNLFVQSSMLRSKMLASPINLANSKQFNQPAVPPRRKPVTPRTQSPIQVPSSVTSPSYRIQTNKNRMAGQQVINSSPRRPQRSTSQIDQNFSINQQSNQPQQQQQLNQPQFNQSFNSMQGSSNNLIYPQANQPHLLMNQQSNQQFNQSSISSNNLTARLSPNLYSPKPTPVQVQKPIATTTTIKPPTISRPESMFRPISSNQMQTKSNVPPIIKIDPSRSSSNLNLSSPSPSTSFINQSRRSPSPQPQSQQPPSSSSSSSFLKRAGSFIQRNTTFMNKHQSKNQDQKNQQSRRSRSRSPLPVATTMTAPSITISPQTPSINNLIENVNQSFSGNTLKIDLQAIRSNRSSRASSPAPPSKDPPPLMRKIFINKDTVEAGSFVDHFNHYYAPQSEPNRRPLSQQFTHLSTGELNKLGRSITPMREFNNQGKQSTDNQPLKRSPSTFNNSKVPNQSTANALIDAPINYERRQTLPEISKVLGVEDTTTAKEESILRNLSGKKKHSLPQNDLNEVPLIPGWEREKVATLAHEAREARMNQPTGPMVHLTAATNWLIKYKLIGLIIFFNAILMYLFIRILQPIDQFNMNNDQSKST